MTLLALELHDAGLVVVGPSALHGEPSPGYALIEGDRLAVGADALDRARLAPRGIHHRFWEQLGTDGALPRPFPAGWRTADLAHAHLEAVWEPFAEEAEGVLLVAPAIFDPRRLGLVLGIARSLEMPVAGLVDLPVAALAGTGAGAGVGVGRILHLDLHLHRAVVTEVVMEQDEALRGRVRHGAGSGRVRLEELWAEHVASRFVRFTRFDPRFDAASDQLLHRRLPGWLAALGERQVIEAAMPSPGGDVAAELTRRGAAAALQPVYAALRDLVHDSVAAGGPATLALSSHVAGLPGLEEELTGEIDDAAGAGVFPLPQGAGGRGALLAERAVRAEGPTADGALPLVTRLPLSHEER